MSIFAARGGLYLISALALVSLLWLYHISTNLTEPYLDEFFHIPQAQAYWAGLWWKWDPKITTPPGLYVYSYAAMKVIKSICSIFAPVASGLYDIDLRFTNWLLYITLPFQLRHLCSQGRQQVYSSESDGGLLVHNIFNICLFPLFFFFSALYYTDLLSTYVVVVSYNWYLYSISGSGRQKTLGRLMLLTWGLTALSVRQTNIFWVAIFLGGLQVVETISKNGYLFDAGFANIIEASFKERKVYDPPASRAGVEDYLKMILSAIILAALSIPDLVLNLWPQLCHLAIFTAFIAWNGGVVLGDKDNHVAGLHLPQMLYIWPCITFFSWPILLANLTNDLSSLRVKIPRPTVALAVLAPMVAAVRYNTIVHPFTLADNRHYVFYVFRILLMHPFVRYAAVPVYFMCAWAVIVAFGGYTEERKLQKSKAEATSVRVSNQGKHPPVRVSFVLVWLIATSLSVITAPLVEPRYFIIPWLVWRVQIAVSSTSEDDDTIESTSRTEQVARPLLKQAGWLRIETGWLLLINLVTCCMFLYRGFEWVQEPGKVQRFMW